MAITIGFAPKATTTDANGMVATAGDVTYPITPADLGAGSFAPTDRITPYHNKLDGVISAAINGGELKGVYGGVEMLSRFKTPDVPLPSALSTTSGGAASDTVAILINDGSSTFFFTYDGINYQSGTITGYSTSGQSFAVFHGGYFYVFKSDSTTYYRAPEDLTSWSTQSLPSVPDTFLSAATSSGVNLVVTGEQNSAVVLRSSTGLTGSWSSSNFQLSTASRKISSDGAGTLVAAGFISNSIEASTDDGATWQSTLSSGLSNPTGCCRFKGNFYVFSSTSNSYVYSPDGSSGSWVSGAYPSGVSVYAVEADENIMVATGSAASDIFLVSSDGLNFKFGSFSSTYTNARWLTAFNGYILTLQRNSQSTVAAIKSTEKVTIDLKPVFHSDGANTDVTIDKSTITDETFYKFTSPVADHRYHFLSSDSSDSGDGTAASGVDTGTIVYDGKSAQSSGGAINTNYFLCTTTLTPKSAIVAFEKTTDNAGNLDLFSTSSGYGSLLIDTNNAAYTTATGTTVDSGFYLKDMNHIMAVIDSGSTLSLYVDGLKVASTGTYTPSSSTFYDCLRSGLKTWLLEIEGTTAITEAQYLERWNDFVKSGKVDQQYVSHNGKSRVVTVKTTGGDFTTTQAAVDALLEGNETVIVFDGISPTATGLPVNAQIIDLAVEPEPTYYNWKAFV